MDRNSIFQKQRIIVLSVLAFIAGIAIFLYTAVIRPEKYPAVTVWTATENDVEVKLWIMKYPSGQLRLSGTFTPTRPQFYLYSKDLPRNGLNGLGRPTLLEVTESDSIKLTGSLDADQPIRDIYVATLDLTFPVYPAGSVTLSLPFELVGDSHAPSMEVAIMYMACSDKTCLPPVINKHILIQVPESFLNN